MTRAIDTCPHCGSHLILKDGEFGEFLACPRFPDCKYTKSIYSFVELKPPRPYCEKCNHTGLLPFIKDEKVIPHTFIDCECRATEWEYYQHLPPHDFDFPCSNSWRGYYYQYCGIPDPCPLPQQSDTVDLEDRIGNLEEISAEPGRIPRRYHDELQQVKASLLYYTSKLNEHVDKAKSKKQPDKAQSYRGIK